MAEACESTVWSFLVDLRRDEDSDEVAGKDNPDDFL